MGNNFGYSAFVAYGSFWIGLGIIWILNILDVYKSSSSDVGYFMPAWTFYTVIMFFASLRVHKAMAGIIINDLAAKTHLTTRVVP